VAQRKFKTNVVICFEPDEAGWVRATLPGMPSVVAAGVSRDDALEMIIAALMQQLAVEPDRGAGGDHERARLDVSIARAVQREGSARGRSKSPARTPLERS
jgi:predicted RNase H-like HicB family nuclease